MNGSAGSVVSLSGSMKVITYFNSGLMISDMADWLSDCDDRVGARPTIYVSDSPGVTIYGYETSSGSTRWQIELARSKGGCSFMHDFHRFGGPKRHEIVNDRKKIRDLANHVGSCPVCLPYVIHGA